MKVVAKHKFAPLVALEDGSIIDTDELEVVGNGSASGPHWEFNVADLTPDPRWAEIARADSANLSVVEKKTNSGERAFRAPKAVKDSLTDNGVDTALAAGSGLTLQELEDLIEQDGVEGIAFEWAAQTLNKHQPNPHAEKEDALFAEAEPHLDYDSIDAAIDALDNADTGEEGLSAAATPTEAPAVTDPPPGQFNKIVYFAVVQQDDTESVQDLIALVQTPAGAADAYAYQGSKKGWKEAAKTLAQLQSPAPPPIQELQPFQVNSIIQQINGSEAGDAGDDSDPDSAPEPVQASAWNLPEASLLWGPDNQRILAIVAMGTPGRGGVDPAQRLRDYWQTGEGGAKIRWGTPGDWTRCHRHLMKYLGVRSAGYCQLMHKRMTGVYTGSRFNVGGNGHHKHAGLITPDMAEFASTRGSTNQRTGNTAVHGNVGGRRPSVPIGQHYVQGGPSEVQQQRKAQQAAAAAAAAAKKAAAQKLAAQKKAAAAAKHAAVQKAAADRKAAAAAKHAAAQKAAADKKAAAAAKKAAKGSGHSSHASVAASEKRTPKGQPGGGRFAPGGARAGNAGSKSGHTYAEDQADPHEQEMYNNAMSLSGTAQKQYLAGLSDKDLQGLTGIAYSSKTSDKQVVAMRIAVANEMAKRGLDVKDYGALGGGLHRTGLKPGTRPTAHKAPVRKPAAHAPAPQHTPTTIAPARFNAPLPTNGGGFHARAE